MFHVKCIDCKNFTADDGCKLNLDDENCARYEKVFIDENLAEPRCEDCAWNSNGFCDFDETSPNECRKFRSKNED